jgi:hypothetical protein
LNTLVKFAYVDARSSLNMYEQHISRRTFEPLEQINQRPAMPHRGMETCGPLAVYSSHCRLQQRLRQA